MTVVADEHEAFGRTMAEGAFASNPEKSYSADEARDLLAGLMTPELHALGMEQADINLMIGCALLGFMDRHWELRRVAAPPGTELMQ